MAIFLTNGIEVIEVGQSILDSGILTRGWWQCDGEITPSTSVPLELPADPESTHDNEVSSDNSYNINELHLIDEVEVPKVTFDHEYLLQLDNQREVKMYMAQFDYNVDIRKSMDNILELISLEYDFPYTSVESQEEISKTLTCPHCGIKANSKTSYIKNHGSNCIRLLAR